MLTCENTYINTSMEEKESEEKDLSLDYKKDPIEWKYLPLGALQILKTLRKLIWDIFQFGPSNCIREKNQRKIYRI